MLTLRWKLSYWLPPSAETICDGVSTTDCAVSTWCKHESGKMLAVAHETATPAQRKAFSVVRPGSERRSRAAGRHRDRGLGDEESRAHVDHGAQTLLTRSPSLWLIAAMPGREDTKAWWKGSRGEWYVVAQLVLFVLVAFGPRTTTPLPALSGFYAKAAMGFGIVLMAIGGGLIVTGIANLGRNLTPLPFPKEGGELVQTGAYSLVRHPVYSGAIALAVGWACTVRGPLTLAYAVLLFLLFDAKSRREERWLETKIPSYAEYRKRVRRLIPFVY